jgi:hypothetical protein
MTTATAPRPKTPVLGVHRTKTHQYYFSGAGPWPGVTSVTKVLDAPALTYWKMNQVAQAAIASAEQLIRDREAGKVDAAVKYLTTLSTSAMDRGSRIHAAIEQILRREPVTIDPRDEAAVAGARAWLNAQVREHGLRPLEVEAYLLHETLGYGGTCDLIAELDGEVWLGRRELPRPAYEAMLRTLADCAKDLATIDPEASLWQAGAGPRGISSGTFYGRFRRYLQAAGLTPTGLHVLRHTAAKLRRDAGASVEAVSAFLDHSSLAVTTVYLRRLEGETDRTWPDVAMAIGL